MDFRNYGQPYFAYPVHPRVHAIRSQSYYDNEHELSLDGLSLSDDQRIEDIFLWTKSSRKQGPQDGHRRGQRGEYQGANNPFVVPKAQGPSIDIALRNLRHELSASLKIFQPLVQSFEADIEPLRDWAEDLTLDTVWKNRVKKFFREKRDRRRYEGMAARISHSRTAVKDAIKNAKVLKETWEDKHSLERQILTAKKAIVFCDGIVGLAERAASERLACKQLVVELEEAKSLLDWKKHPWICESAPAITQAPATSRTSRGGPTQD
jgi:hypothetical protein